MRECGINHAVCGLCLILKLPGDVGEDVYTRESGGGQWRLIHSHHAARRANAGSE